MTAFLDGKERVPPAQNGTVDVAGTPLMMRSTASTTTVNDAARNLSIDMHDPPP